jgi:hypothetical protein
MTVAPRDSPAWSPLAAWAAFALPRRPARSRVCLTTVAGCSRATPRVWGRWLLLALWLSFGRCRSTGDRLAAARRQPSRDSGPWERVLEVIEEAAHSLSADFRAQAGSRPAGRRLGWWPNGMRAAIDGAGRVVVPEPCAMPCGSPPSNRSRSPSETAGWRSCPPRRRCGW